MLIAITLSVIAFILMVALNLHAYEQIKKEKRKNRSMQRLWMSRYTKGKKINVREI